MWLRREEVEDEELRNLDPAATKSRGPFSVRRDEETADPVRTALQRDRDRILHSRAFRRLQHKTQVVAAFEGDHYRTRLTHSLEVSQMARGAARSLRLNSDLAEAVALGHDLGHPPFGHVGERALHERMREFGGFRHNAHGTRIVDALEDRRQDGLGLNLTLATRRSLLKGKLPEGFPVAEDLAEWRRVGPHDEIPIEARVVDLCDRIAYLAHDLDDGLRAGVFTTEDTKSLRLWQDASAQCDHPELPARVISQLITNLIHDLVRASAQRLAQREPGVGKIGHSSTTSASCQEALDFLGERFYRSRRVMTVMELGEERILAAFEHYVSHPEDLPLRSRERLETDGAERVVCDYVAGMTDRYLMDRAGGRG